MQKNKNSPSWHFKILILTKNKNTPDRQFKISLLTKNMNIPARHFTKYESDRHFEKSALIEYKNIPHSAIWRIASLASEQKIPVRYFVTSLPSLDEQKFPLGNL